MIEASWRTRVLFSVKLVRNEQKKLSGGEAQNFPISVKAVAPSSLLHATPTLAVSWRRVKMAVFRFAK